MDGRAFDQVTRHLAAARSRRGTLAAAGTAILATLLAPRRDGAPAVSATWARGAPIPRGSAGGAARDDAQQTSGVRGNQYTSPTWGYTFTWDAGQWGIVTGSEQVGTAHPTDGTTLHDAIQLFRGSGVLWIEGYRGETTAPGEAGTCLSANIGSIGQVPGLQDFQPARDPAGQPIQGATGEGIHYAIYTYSVTDSYGSPFAAAIYMECRPLVPGQAVLIAHYFGPRATFNEDLAAALAVIETIQLPQGGTIRDPRGGNQGGIVDPRGGAPAVPIGGACVSGGQCDARRGAVCASVAGGTTQCCLESGGACASSMDCCGWLECLSSVCGEQVTPPTPTPEVCGEQFDDCFVGSDCCDGYYCSRDADVCYRKKSIHEECRSSSECDTACCGQTGREVGVQLSWNECLPAFECD